MSFRVSENFPELLLMVLLILFLVYGSSPEELDTEV